MAFDVTIAEDNGGSVNYANDNLFFGAQISYGPILLEQIKSDAMAIEGNVNKSDIIANYFQYSINSIDKYLWSTQDGFFYSTPKIIHSFATAGTYVLALTVTSEEKFYNGIPFRFVYTYTQNTNVSSFFYKMIIKNMPMWQFKSNQETADLITASSNFFDRMYRDIKGLYNLIDVENIDPTYFEYLASTLGHNNDYAKKVGGNVNDDTFEQYDIFQRIKGGIATPTEIQNFRRFLLLSVDIFKTGGTSGQVRKLLSFFSIDAKAIDLWTQYWGIQTKGSIDETFSGLSSFENNALGLKWQNVRVVGNDNDQGQLSNEFNSFIIDNYHTTQKLNFPANALSQDVEYVYFGIYNNAPIFKEVRREDGNLIVSEDITSDYYDIVPNEDTDPNLGSSRIYPWLLKIKTQYLEDGDRLTVNYQTTSEATYDSVVANTQTTVKNMDFSVKFKYLPIPKTFEDNNIKIQDNEIFLLIRGNKISDNVNTDMYDDFNEYYRLSLNAKRSTVSLSKVIKNPTNEELITQKINLNQADTTNPIFEQLIVQNGQTVSFKFNTAYDIKVSITDSAISAYYKESTEFNEIVSKIEANEGEVPFGKALSTWIPLFENVNMAVSESQVVSTNSLEEVIPAYPYAALLTAGYYGIGVRNSIVEILEANLNNLDFEDSLYTDEEKELNLKPKYLEWQNSTPLLMNSYLDSKTDTFGKTLSKSFDPTVTQYVLPQNEAKAFNYLYFDNAPISEEIGSRYTVTFDPTWIKNNFNNEQEVMSKIIVPFGSQPSWFATESRIFDKSFYKNYFGEDAADHNFGTNEVPNQINSPGYFAYNLSTTLGLYKVEPLDEFSSITRIDTRDIKGTLISSSMKANTKVDQYKLSNNAIRMRGLYEEVCPNSTVFSNAALCGEIVQNTTDPYENALFFPIVFNSLNDQRVVGVRFKNCSDITNIITRVQNGTDIVPQVQLYGLFMLQMPIEAVKFRPDLSKNLEVFADDQSTVIIKMFVPLGLLNKEIQNYSLSTEYMHEVNNSGATAIALDSVYIRIPREIMIYKEQENTFNLPTLNPYENDEESLKCRYYLSADLELSTNLNDYEKVNTGIAYKYMMNYDFRKLMDGLIKNKSDFDSYLWWIPKELWRKRDFTVLNLDTTSDVATGLNFNNTSSKYFYGTKVGQTSSMQSLRISIKDGPITPYTTYYAKIKFRMNWSGFDELLLGNASLVDGTVKPARPLKADEASSLVTIGGKSSKYINSMPATVGECMDFYVPISWYPEGEIPPDNIIQWGNYIKGNSGDAYAPTVSLTPYGLMTYFMMHATDSNFNSVDIAQVTSGWTVQDWNERFMQFVTVEYVAESIPSTAYKLYDEFGFVTKYASINGAKLNIEYDAGDIPEWKVLETVTMLPKAYNSYYFGIPSEIYRLSNWVQDITSIHVTNYVVPFNLYTVNNNTINLISDPLYTIMSGGELNTRFSFDILFTGSNNSLTFTDNFFDIREISWINYQENHIKDVLELAIRTPSESLFLSGSDPILQLSSIDGVPILKSVEGATINAYDPLLSGVSINNPGSISISKDDNGGYAKTVSLIDEQNDVYDLDTLVWFDNVLNTTTNYNGKKFEYILKAETTFNSNTNTFILSSYYFVGIGTYNFEVALGVAKYNPDTNTMEKTFLAGFGDYNSNNIKADTWYRLKVVVDANYIKVIFNDEQSSDRMVIKYNIDINYQKDINKYLSGQFEELVYLVTGLDKMKITYPDHLKSIAGDSFYNNNWNETWAANIRPTGPYSGIKLFNPYTYVKNVTYKARIQDDKTFTTANELVDLNSIIIEIEKNYKVNGIIESIGKTANGGIIIKYGTDLFHKLPNKFIAKRYGGVEKMFVTGNKIVIKFNSTNALALVVADENFANVQNVYVKDNFFNYDHIYKYMLWTERDIDELYANPTNLYVTFKDV